MTTQMTPDMSPEQRADVRKARRDEQSRRDAEALSHAAKNPVDPAERKRLKEILGRIG